MQGNSRAALIECDDGKYYVVKSNGSPLRPNVLANEWLGSVLAASVGLPVSKSQFVYVDPSLLTLNSAVMFDTPTGNPRTRVGLHVGSLFAGEVSGPHRIVQFLPRALVGNVANRACFLGMYLFDIWAGQPVPRKVIFRRTVNRSLEAVFINHGNLFGGASWSGSEWKMFGRHREISLYSGLWNSRAVSSWIGMFRKKLPDVLHTAIAEIPSHWYVGELEAVRASLLSRLDDLPELCERCSTIDGLQAAEFPSE